MTKVKVVRFSKYEDEAEITKEINFFLEEIGYRFVSLLANVTDSSIMYTIIYNEMDKV